MKIGQYAQATLNGKIIAVYDDVTTIRHEDGMCYTFPHSMLEAAPPKEPEFDNAIVKVGSQLFSRSPELDKWGAPWETIDKHRWNYSWADLISIGDVEVIYDGE